MGTKTGRVLVATDCEQYLSSKSDFAFELKVLKGLNDLKCRCEHSGTYADPITGKYREFDIRVRRDTSVVRLRVAMECKNISASAPLLAHLVNRKKSEAYHYMVEPVRVTNGDGRLQTIGADIQMKKYCEDRSVYNSGSNSKVCKNLAHIWEEEEKGRKDIVGRDSEIYEKWAQAVNSCYDMILEEAQFHSSNDTVRSFILPVLVIPDGTLWTTYFIEDGSRNDSIQPSTHISLFLGTEISPWNDLSSKLFKSSTYSISHLEVITFSEIEKFMSKLISCFKEEDCPALS